MAKVSFQMKQEDVEKIKLLLESVPENAENTINNYLHNTAKGKLTKSITNYIPKSPKTTIHAKENKWYETKDFNLAVQISNARKFYYIYFPLTATGTSINKSPNDFFTKGVERVYEDVVGEMMEEIKNNLLGGK